MKLVTVAKVRDRIGYDSMSFINDTIASILDNVTVTLSTILRTEFTRGTFNDYYFVDEAKAHASSYLTKFKLKRGFVDGAEDITVTYAASYTDMATGEDVSDYVVAGTNDLIKGLINIVDYALKEQVLKIAYTAGFNVDATDPTLFDQSEVPTWLQEAAILLALAEVGKNDTITEEPIPASERKALRESAEAIITPYIRYMPSALIASF